MLVYYENIIFLKINDTNTKFCRIIKIVMIMIYIIKIVMSSSAYAVDADTECKKGGVDKP